MIKSNSKGITRIAIIGPESTGKSLLAEQLSDHFDTNWIPEYARIFLSELNRPYTAADIIEIYKTQFIQEKTESCKANKLLFVDTEFIIGKVWMEHAFKTSHEYFDQMIQQAPYDLYLLTYPDLPWEYDPLRENPGKGMYFYEWYKRILIEHQFSYGVVTGTGNLRLTGAKEIIEQYLKKSKSANADC
ncbi:MAG: ATP-binding protein [Bacteroidetes bacterium]|nr:ATP-binding protein [Bacteroidota bacterium]